MSDQTPRSDDADTADETGFPSRAADVVMRHERKFIARAASPAGIRDLIRLNPAVFRVEHPPRRVNNLYLDTPYFRHARAHLAGAAERVKLRVRWYGDEGTEARFEIKRRAGTASCKETLPLPGVAGAFALDAGTLSSSGERVREAVRGHRFTLANHYMREYFRSADGRLRLTIDSAATFRPMRPGGGCAGGDEPMQGLVILELKYAPADEARALEAAARLPFRLSRSSKYITGLRRTGLLTTQ